jgi:hypothetical protein
LSTFRATGPRRLGREVIAFTFWLHALYAASFLHLPARLAIHPPKYRDTLVLALIIAFYSLFAEREWISVLVDCVYAYLWPCIITVKVSWVTIKAIYRFLKANLVVQSPGLIQRPTRTPPLAINASQESSPTPEPTPEPKRSIVGWVLKPFTEFSLLWSLMILTTENRVIIVIATSVAVYCAGRAIYELWAFTSDASTWVEKLKGSFAKQIATHVGQVRAWEEMTQIDEVTKAANALKMLESIFSFIADNKKFLARVTAGIAACVSIIFYCYISFVFSCAYVGMSKVQGIPWIWSDLFATSLYMPMAFTNLPRNFPIEFLGGLQGVAIIVLGWNIFFRHMNSGFQRIAVAVSELRGPFEDRVLRVKFTLIQEQMAKLGPVIPVAAVSTAAVSDPPKTEPAAPSGDGKGFRQSKKRSRSR